MKREKRLTKRERKALAPARPAQPHEHKHIHCVACGKHLDPEEFLAQGSATWIQCLHKSRFATCIECVEISKRSSPSTTAPDSQFSPLRHGTERPTPADASARPNLSTPARPT